MEFLLGKYLLVPLLSRLLWRESSLYLSPDKSVESGEPELIVFAVRYGGSVLVSSGLIF